MKKNISGVFVLALIFFGFAFCVLKMRAQEPDDGGSGGTSYDYSEFDDYEANRGPEESYVPTEEPFEYIDEKNDSGGGEGWNYLPGTSNYKKDNNDGQYYFAADDGTFRNGNGEVYPYELPGTSGGGQGAGGENIASNYTDRDGNPIFTDENGYTVYKNGEYVQYSGNDFVDAQTGKQFAAGQDGNLYEVNWDSSGKAYATGTDGKTKWYWDENGKLSATGENGEKFTLDGNGNVVSSSGSVVSSESSIAPKGTASGTFFGNTNTRTGSGSWLSNLFGLGGTSRTGGYGYGTGMTGSYGMTGAGGGILGGILGGGTPYGTGTGAAYGTSGYYTGSYGGVSGIYGAGAGGSGWNPANYIGTGLPAGSIYNIIKSVVMWILAIFGFICIVGFIISGIMYLLAAGDEKSQEKAKKALYYSITGVIVGLVGLVIIFAVNALLRGASYF
ncbi:MAG: pilin [Patescibacteria group bacterium]|nr:pilin [Patescibacteria group bacterium]